MSDFQAVPGDQSAPGWQELNGLYSAGHSFDEIDEYKAQTTLALQQAGHSDDEVNDYWGQKKPDVSQTSDIVNTNINDMVEESKKRPVNPKHADYATNLWQAFGAGLQSSTWGLELRGKMPDTEIDPNEQNTGMRVAGMVGQFAGDSPDIAVGSLLGAGGGPAGMAAGGMGLAAFVRKGLIDQYQKGDIQNVSEFSDRVLGETVETAKAAATAYAATALGGIAGTVAGEAAGKVLPEAASSAISTVSKLGTEIGAYGSIGAGLEGRMPNRRDFTDAAIVMGGMHGLGFVAGKLGNAYAATEAHPSDIAAEAEKNVELKQQLLSHDMEQPPEAAPTKLERVPIEETQEGSTEKPKTQMALVKDESINDFSPKVKDVERSPEEQEVISKMKPERDKPNKSIGEKFDDWYAKTVDFTDPLKVAVSALKDKTGIELEADKDPHVLARIFAGFNDKVRMTLEHGFQNNDGDFDGKGLNDIYRRVPDNDQLGFDAYSVAKRGIELHEQGKVPWKDFNLENAKKLVEAGKDKFEGLHRERVDFANKALLYGVKAGVLNIDMVKASVENNNEYIPFGRIIPPDELTGEIHGNGKLINKIEGSELDLKDPRLSLYKNVEAIMRRADINKIRMSALENLSFNPDGNYDHGNTQNDFLREVRVDGGLKKNQIAIFRDGKVSALEGTPGVIESLKRLEGDPTIAGTALKIAGAFAKAVRVGSTADPGFGIRHSIRTSIMSGFYTKTGQVPFIHPVQYLSEFMKGESDNYRNWLYDGGASQGLDDIKKSYIDSGLQESDQKFPYLNQAWNVIKKPFEATESFVKMTDNLSRFTEYSRAIDQGKSRTKAAFLAREVTPDFQKVGLQRSAMRIIVAFQGAHINSLDRMAQGIKEDPGQFSIGAGAMVAATAALWFVTKDDKDIQDQAGYLKDQYWSFKVPAFFDSKNNDEAFGGQKPSTIFHISKPWSAGIMIASGTERVLDAYYKKNPNAIEGFGKSLFDSVVPNLTPSMLSPVMDQLADKNLFSGRQLVNDQQKKMLPEMQYQPYTSETAKQLGRAIGYVPYVKDLGPSEDPLASPEVVENYVKGWGGRLGSWALQASDAALRATGVTPKNTGPSSVAWTAADYPILNEFMTRFPSMKTQPVENFYKNLDEVTKVQNSINQAYRKNNPDQGNQIFAEHQEEMMPLKGVSQAISNGKKYIDMIQQNPTIDPVQKRQLIDTALFQIGSMANMGNQMAEEFKKAQKGQSK